MWGLTIENEPSAGATDNAWQAMYLSAEMERDFIKKDLGPALHQAGYADVKLMVLDDQRLFLPSYVQTVKFFLQFLSKAISHSWYGATRRQVIKCEKKIRGAEGRIRYSS